MSRHLIKLGEALPIIRPVAGYRVYRDIFGSDAPPPPDYSSLANASKESAQIMSGLGDRQLAESTRQYDLNRQTADPVVRSQLGLMRQTKDQGDDYYNYMVSRQRPVEDLLNAEVLGLSADQSAELRRLQAEEDAVAESKYQQLLAAQQPSVPTATQQTIKVPTYSVEGGAPIYEQGAVQQSDGSWVVAYTDPNMSNEAGWAPTQYRPANITGYTPQVTSQGTQDFTFDVPSSGSSGGTSVARPLVDRSRSSAYATEAGLRSAARGNAEISAQEAVDAQDRAALNKLITASNTDIYNRSAGEIEQDVGRAVADARTGSTSATNAAIRQGLRYGFSPARMASSVGSTALASGLKQAAAANATRTAGIDTVRGRLLSGAQQTQSQRQQDFGRNRGYRMQDKATDWAKKLDVAGLYRGLPGASQGAYSLANQSGNSAVQNQMAPGQALQSGMAAGANTIGQGQQLKLQGLGNILNAQTSYANANSGDDGTGASLIGAAGSMAAAFI